MDKQTINRRDFVSGVALSVCGGALAVSACGGCASQGGGGGDDNAGTGSNYQLPPETDANGTVDLGTVADYPHDDVYDKYARSNRVYVVRQGNRLYALRSMCSHRACLVTPRDSEFRCPCHGSRFQLDGTVTKGPATRPLTHYAIAKLDGGKLMVDKSKRLTPELNDPAASVTV